MLRNAARVLFTLLILNMQDANAINGYEVEYLNPSTNSLISASLSLVSKSAGWLFAVNGITYPISKPIFTRLNDGLYMIIVTSAYVAPILAKITKILD